MKVLVTGAGGFLGSRIIAALSSSNHEVTGATTKIDLGNSFKGEFELRTIDWDSTDSLNEICVDQNVVIHAAGMNFQECAADPNRASDFNGRKTASLIEAAVRNGVESFVYLSTVHVYADPLEGSFLENSIVTSENAYAKSHLLGEKALLEKINSCEISGKVLRVGNAFGAPILFGTGAPWNNLVNQCCKSLVERNEVEINNNPNTERDYIPIRYLLSEIEQILQSRMGAPAQVVNLVSGSSFSISQVLQLILKVFRNYSIYDAEPTLLFNQPNAAAKHLSIQNSDPTILSPFHNDYLIDEMHSIFQYLTETNHDAP